jgi:hypothetical protein
MNKKLQQILRHVALCTAACLALGVVTGSAFASSSDDLSADGWQTLTVVGDQPAITAPTTAKAGQKSDVQGGVATNAGQPTLSSAVTVGSIANRADDASNVVVDQSVATVAVAPGASTSQAEVKPVWHVEMADSTFQKLFGRWAMTAGWTSRWDVPQDIPVIAEYTFEGSFTDAVFSVTDSTDGTDMPIHPCFYTNNLVRIVPVSVVCNPANN